MKCTKHVHFMQLCTAHVDLIENILYHTMYVTSLGLQIEEGILAQKQNEEDGKF